MMETNLDKNINMVHCDKVVVFWKNKTKQNKNFSNVWILGSDWGRF
jgi:hypothetical protein